MASLDQAIQRSLQLKPPTVTKLQETAEAISCRWYTITTRQISQAHL